jgi:hypothetical protein
MPQAPPAKPAERERKDGGFLADGIAMDGIVKDGATHGFNSINKLF